MDAIDGSHQRGRFAQTVEMCRSRNFVGNGQIAAAKAHAAYSAQGVGQVGFGPTSSVRIAPIEPGIGKSLFHDELSWIAGHRLTQTADDFLNRSMRRTRDLGHSRSERLEG